MTTETQSKEWDGLEEIDLAEFIVEAYNKGDI